MRRIIGFLFSCLLVGIVLHWLGATPSTLGVWIADTSEGLVQKGKDFIAWGGGYILMGAMILVPLAALRWLFGRRRSR
ncbi:MAG: hypothetical protein AAF562_09365 [Pseudomonadota bacterium]